ncbi:hypothetical protein [Hymenobacter terrigena]
MKTLTHIAYFLTLFLLTGCKSAAEKAIDGLWSIDTIIKDGQEYMGCFGSNVWAFESDGSCVLPTDLRCSELNLRASDKQGIWKFDSKDRALRIYSANKFFNRSYRVDFVDDTIKRMLVMRLTSDNVSITCRKGLYFYDKAEVIELVN